MKNNNWLKYSGYILLIAALIYLDGYVEKQQYIYQRETFNLSFVYFAISMIIKISIGLLLGLEYIIKEIRKEGNWKINLSKIILMVIPSLYFSMSYLFMYLYNDNLIYRILTYPGFIFIQNGSGFVFVFQLVLGYSLITSFYKQSKGIKKETIT
ncbi:hypothetical protein [Tissierella creatinophila]|uniref:Uncharacterized protein n=1 Tax=Tissierella creatinophila DSM 6911 TaxID=1123403 RepID=A0A1U7M6X8_TISCR|nr:hypothetical protein [Tissierella creatinophila]OLS03036.1 hypothetical protein TICRE_07320 [Tissierella creatinophila DSM 6911]